MKLSERLQALTKRERILLVVLGITGVVVVCLYVYPLLMFGKPAISSVSTLPPAVQTSRVINGVPMQAVQIDNVKNPFFVPPSYRVRRNSVPAGDSAVRSAGTMDDVGQGAKTENKAPVLNGIITNATVKMAIIEVAGNSDTLRVGSSIGGYTVTEITDTQVTVKGREGSMVLSIGGDPR